MRRLVELALIVGLLLGPFGGTRLPASHWRWSGYVDCHPYSLDPVIVVFPFNSNIEPVNLLPGQPDQAIIVWIAQLYRWNNTQWGPRPDQLSDYYYSPGHSETQLAQGYIRVGGGDKFWYQLTNAPNLPYRPQHQSMSFAIRSAGYYYVQEDYYWYQYFPAKGAMDWVDHYSVRPPHLTDASLVSSVFNIDERFLEPGNPPGSFCNKTW